MVEPTPLKNDGVRQLGWWHSQYMETYNSCFKPPTSGGRSWLDHHPNSWGTWKKSMVPNHQMTYPRIWTSNYPSKYPKSKNKHSSSGSIPAAHPHGHMACTKRAKMPQSERPPAGNDWEDHVPMAVVPDFSHQHMAIYGNLSQFMAIFIG